MIRKGILYVLSFFALCFIYTFVVAGLPALIGYGTKDYYQLVACMSMAIFARWSNDALWKFDEKSHKNKQEEMK